jgi:ubiquitin-like-conjugating enzyme ATG10
MLDWNTFESECLDIQRRSQALNPNDRWLWKTLVDPAVKESSYLEGGQVRFSTKKFNEDNDIQEDQIEEIEDPASVTRTQISKGNPAYYVFEYHIVYSTTYRVPVLYFNAYKADSSLLTLDEVWDELQPTEMTEDNKWSFITQGEHPLLGIPFFFIHPCQTQQLMQQIKTMHGEDNKPRYLLPWLSVFAPTAGLKLPTQLFMDK